MPLIWTAAAVVSASAVTAVAVLWFPGGHRWRIIRRLDRRYRLGHQKGAWEERRAAIEERYRQAQAKLGVVQANQPPEDRWESGAGKHALTQPIPRIDLP
jgi:hypothetical protein